jgi:ATP-dependent helicase/DNAse subunit B
MIKDKYSATWVSHSSISDYLKCPRSYFLKNIYRNPKTEHKIQLIQPSLALGQAVHEVIEIISKLTAEERFKESLFDRYELLWKKISGKMGGFKDKEEEDKFKKRGFEMIRRIEKNPGPLLRKAVKLRQDLPYYWLSEEDNIILCGKIDWLEYVPETDSVKIMDFKTGKYDEDPESLQLLIYYLLVDKCQNRKISGISYWYLDRDDEPVEQQLPDPKKSHERILEIAKKIQLARKLEHFVCRNKNGCFACRSYEKIFSGQAKFIGTGGYNQDIYIL